MEILYIYSIWFYLRFQTEAIPLGICMTTFALDRRLDKVACIELNTWTVRSHIHHNTAFLAISAGNRRQFPLA